MTLARWGREEAAEDELRRRLREAEAGRVRIVFAREARSEVVDIKPRVEEIEVPRVEHEGGWHTLH